MNETLDIARLEASGNAALTWLQENLFDWHVLLQLALLGLIWGVAWLLARRLRPGLEERTARLSGAWRVRPLTEFLPQQLATILYTLGLWILIGVMRHVTWPSYSYLLGVAATLLSAWLIIRLTSTLIRNPILARMIAVFAWTVAALNITGLVGPAVELMDALAIHLGDLRVSVLTVVKGTLLLAVLMWGAVTLATSFERRISRLPDLAPSVRVLLGMALRFTLLMLAVVIALNSVGIDLTALAVLSGAIGVGIGFGLQKVISNLISGVILLLDRSIKPGDVIQLGNTFGWITSLGARYVSLVTRDGKEYLLPNEDLITHQVVNWSYSDELVRIETRIRASYDSNPHQVREVARSAAARPARVEKTPAPVCHLCSFGENSLEFLLRFWIRDPKNGVENITGEVLLAVWDAFRENGIRIPYPQREIRMHDPLSMQPSANPGGNPG